MTYGKPEYQPFLSDSSSLQLLLDHHILPKILVDR